MPIPIARTLIPCYQVADADYFILIRGWPESARLGPSGFRPTSPFFARVLANGRMSQTGHEDPFPRPRPSGRYRFRKRSLCCQRTGHVGFWVRF